MPEYICRAIGRDQRQLRRRPSALRQRVQHLHMRMAAAQQQQPFHGSQHQVGDVGQAAARACCRRRRRCPRRRCAAPRVASSPNRRRKSALHVAPLAAPGHRRRVGAAQHDAAHAPGVGVVQHRADRKVRVPDVAHRGRGQQFAAARTRQAHHLPLDEGHRAAAAGRTSRRPSARTSSPPLARRLAPLVGQIHAPAPGQVAAGARPPAADAPGCRRTDRLRRAARAGRRVRRA